MKTELCCEPTVENPISANCALVILLGSVGFALLVLLSFGSLMKEDALFWRNAGGYPVPMREAVLVLYYPLLAGVFLICCVVSALGISAHRIAAKCSLISIGIAVALWSLLFLNVGFVAANNVENLLEGHALHDHPAPR